MVINGVISVINTQYNLKDYKVVNFPTYFKAIQGEIKTEFVLSTFKSQV